MMSDHAPPSPHALERLRDLVGPAGWKAEPNDIAPYLEEPRRRWFGKTPLVLLPDSTEQVGAVVSVCAEHRIALVPQGGNTGLVGGQIPTGDEIVLSLSRLDRIRELDTLDGTITAEAGCVLAALQDEADEAGRLFPLSLASEGSCQLGGVLSTNAGGNAVLRYGTIRDLVLGLEVVTPQGEIWNGLKSLRKDNTGYDLKQLFIGAEGTLGIITAATCKLFARPRETVTAFAALHRLEDAMGLLALAGESAGELISAFELICRQGVELVLAHIPSTRDPFAEAGAWYVLIELSTGQTESRLRTLVETILETALSESLIADAVLAENEQQRQDFWRLRESLPEAQTKEGASLKHDISVPLSALPRFMDEATRAVTELVPDIRPVPFGHIGDGNVHFNLTQPTAMDAAAYLAARDDIAERVHGIAHRLGGSISAEHGLGVAKREEILKYKSPVEMELMRSVKRALDPDNIMNPGKVL